MVEPYDVLKFAHVMLAMLAVGFNASYSIWIGRASRDTAHLDHVLRGVKVIDDRLANPAYVFLLLTGAGLVWLGGWSWRDLWLWASLALWLAVALLGFLLYTPTLRRQIEALRRHGPHAREYAALAKRGTTVGIVLAVLVVGIVFLMVAKPTL